MRTRKKVSPQTSASVIVATSPSRVRASRKLSARARLAKAPTWTANPPAGRALGDDAAQRERGTAGRGF